MATNRRPDHNSQLHQKNEEKKIGGTSEMLPILTYLESCIPRTLMPFGEHHKRCRQSGRLTTTPSCYLWYLFTLKYFKENLNLKRIQLVRKFTFVKMSTELFHFYLVKSIKLVSKICGII